MKVPSLKVGVALALSVLPLVVAAQAGVSNKALGGSAPAKGAVMTREELRACIKEQQAQSAQAADFEKRRAEVDAEAAAVRQQAEGVQADKTAYQAKGSEAAGLKERLKAHGERVAVYNQRLKEFQENPPRGADAERDRGQLEAEGEAVARADEAIKSEAAQFEAALQMLRSGLNVSAKAQAAAATKANERSRAFNDDVTAYDTAVEAWKQRCGNRPYRDADEKAIRAEK